MSPSEDILLAKLAEFDGRCAELAEQMNDPAVAGDRQKIVSLTKEHARLSKIVEPYRRYKHLAEQRDQARTILDDPQADEELKKLAEAEIEQLSRQLDEVLRPEDETTGQR